MAMMSFLMSCLLAMSLVLNPMAGAETPAGKVTLSDTVVEINGESFPLEADARLAYGPDGDQVNIEFALLDGEDALFPARAAIREGDILAGLDGMSRSVRIPLAEIMGQGQDSPQARELSESFMELVQILQEKGKEQQGGDGSMFQRGEPEQTTVEFEDETYPVTCWTYSIALEDVAAAEEETLKSDPRLEAALNRYLNAAMAMQGEALPEGGVPQVLLDSQAMVDITVVESVNEEQELRINEVFGSVSGWSEEGEQSTVDLNMQAVTLGTTAHISMDMVIDGSMTLSLVSDSFQDEEGTHSVTNVENSLIFEDSGESDYEEYDYDGLEEDEDGADYGDGQEDGEALESSAAMIGGADGPTCILVAQTEGETVSVHMETLMGIPAEDGSTPFTAEFFMIFGEDQQFSVDAEGTIRATEEETEINTALKAMYSDQTQDYSISTNLNIWGGKELAVEAPVEDSVDLSLTGDGEGVDQDELTALQMEAMTVAAKDSQRLMQMEGVSGMVSAFMAGASSMSTEEDYGDYEDEDYEDEDYDGEEGENITDLAEAERLFGAETPLREQLGRFTFDNAYAADGYISATYVDEEGEWALFVSVYSSEAPAYYRLTPEGKVELVEETLYTFYGDYEDGSFSASWNQGDLSLNIQMIVESSEEEVVQLIRELEQAR